VAATGTSSQRGRLPELAKYDVVEEIGHGGMATVYRAHDARLGRDVAIKLIHPHLRDSPEVAHRFFVEAQAVAKLRHPNIVEVYDVSAPEEPEQYLVVELLRGRTLRKMLQEVTQAGDKERRAIPPEVAAALGVELCAALAHAHDQGVVHRDIKPENVMIEHAVTSPKTSAKPEGERIKVKLTDFGIAKLLDAQGVTSTGQVLGSPAHMAPEQIEGADVDGRADVFGMGVLLYECMVGHLPFEGANPAQVLRRVLDGTYPSAERERGTVGKTWSELLDRALAHDPAARFPDARAMHDALLDELRRLGFTAPRAEIEAFGDDPAAYVEVHEKRMIERLCDRARAARQAGDSLAAAADYNRALAYAPHDQSLLRVVSSMHRAEERRRVVARVAPAVLGAIALGTTAYFVTNMLRRRAPPSVDPAAQVAAPPAAIVAPAIAASALAARAPASASASALAIAPLPAPAPAPRPSASAKPQVQRSVVIRSVTPQFGVRIAVDGDPAVAASKDLRITLNGEEHALAFTCTPADLCEPDQERRIPVGDRDEVIDVVMKIKPALLTVEGDPQSSYHLREDPTISLRPGAPGTIPMGSNGRKYVHVVQLPSNRTESVSVIAGKPAFVSFLGPPTPASP